MWMEVVKVIAAAGIYALAGLRAAIDAWAPSYEAEEESDRAGRLGELLVADLFECAKGVSVFPSLRIPDTWRRGKREIDVVIVTKKKLYVIEVKNWSGVIKLQPDGSWCQLRRNGSMQILPNVVEDTRYRAELLAAYISRRGLQLPSDFIEYKVFLVNSDCRPEEEILNSKHVLMSNEWKLFLEKDMQTESSSWLKELLPGLLKDTSKDAVMHEQLNFILNTSPTWDRLQLEGGRIVVGDFLHFKGRNEDIEALRSVKRSNYSDLSMKHDRGLLQNILGLLVGVCPAVKVSCRVRDVREGLNKRKKKVVQSSSSATMIKVQPNVEIVFRAAGSNQSESFKINNVLSMSLSV